MKLHVISSKTNAGAHVVHVNLMATVLNDGELGHQEDYSVCPLDSSTAQTQLPPHAHINACTVANMPYVPVKSTL